MKDKCKCELRNYMSACFYEARSNANLTQEQFAEVLFMSRRAYSALEHGENFCCTLTFIFYFVFLCDDIVSFKEDLRRVILNSMGLPCDQTMP